MGLTAPIDKPLVDAPGKPMKRAGDPFFSRSTTNSPTRAFWSRDGRPHHLGAHRFADVDDIRARLLRRRDDADVDAALRR
jgi:hypothetical protein